MTRPRLPLALSLLSAACGSPEPVLRGEGELIVEQIGLGSGATGEAALIVGPDGSSLLLDLGNDRHADDIVEALERHGLDRSVDHVLLTHYHADHIGGFDDLFEPSRRNDERAVSVTGSVISRGPYDTLGVNESEYEEVCAWLQDHPSADLPLCSGAAAPCDQLDQGAWPAADCAALPLELDLGSSASLTILAANAHVASDEGIAAMSDLDEFDPSDAENARSLVGLLRYGDFAMVLGGDLTGGGKDTPDLESYVAEQAGGELNAVDVLQLNHHGIASSTNQTWTDLLLPADGRSRNALIGSNGTYLAAPAQEVLDRIGARLGGGLAWVTRAGSFAGEHERLREVDGSLLLRVHDGGGSYALQGLQDGLPLWFESTPWEESP